MVVVEETQLLRAVKRKTWRTVVLVAAIATAANTGIAQEATGEADFAPGAQGTIKAPVMEILRQADQDAEKLRSKFQFKDPAGFKIDVDLEALRERALNNPRVRALLDTEGPAGENMETAPKYGNDRIFLFASFSMPERALQSLMVEAKRFNVPIVFRGFVNNSVFDTQQALQRVFGDDAETVGFGIDPTLFSRFGIETVPQVVVARDIVGPCDTQGCEGDVAPAHDVVAGNIPVEAALKIIAEGDGEAAEVARLALGGGQ